MDLKELNKPLDKKHVRSRSQAGFTLSYIEGHHAIREANRIFGFDGWNRETVYCKEVSRIENYNSKYKVGYEAKVRITVDDVVREGTGLGSGIAKDLFDAIEVAAKEAETDAMKRALMTFGDPFGLALYDKQQKHVTDDPELQEKVNQAKKLVDAASSVDELKDVWKLLVEKGVSDHLKGYVNKRKAELENAK